MGRQLLARARLAPASAEGAAWSTYLAAVEPGVAAQPRVHRFAQVPLVAESSVAPREVAVWIEGEGSPRERTLAALPENSVRAAEVLEGRLPEALASTRASHVLLVRAGDVLAPLALERLGQAAALAPDADVVTCDEDELDEHLRRHSPRFRPGPSPDLWLACDDSSGTLLVGRESAARRLGELCSRTAWRHELALRLGGPDGRRAAHVPLLLSHRGHTMAADPPLELAATTRLLSSWDPSAWAEQAGSARRIRRRQAGEPTVEVIICLRDGRDLLARCVDSLCDVSDYDRLSLTLVDNGSEEPETLELLGRYERQPNIRVIRDDRPFNFAALNNAAARTSEADVLVFLNNDTAILQSDWISVLLEEATRPEVGAVAPLLLYPDGRVQHAGAVIGLHGYAGHPFAGLKPEAHTPFGAAAQGTRNWLAVTAACMMVERAKFNHVGGFDDSFVVAGNDVDLCLRLTRAGYRSICVPEVTLLHDESRSRGSHIDPADFVRSEESYGAFRTMGDPFYNPNLTLDATDCGVRVSASAAT